MSVRKAKETWVFDEEESWRKKLTGLVLASGIVVKNIKAGEDVVV